MKNQCPLHPDAPAIPRNILRSSTSDPFGLNTLECSKEGCLYTFAPETAQQDGPKYPQLDGHTPAENTVDKDTNPKDAIGTKKLPLHLVPESGIAMTAMAFVEGALKYGKYNWRIAGVRSSIYLDALRRHFAKYLNGEDVDPKTGVSHLASICACAMIIMDARLCGKLNDDRPPRAPVGTLIDLLAEDVTRLQELFKDHRPHQYTIQDGVSE